MTLDEYAALDATALAALVKDKQIGAAELAATARRAVAAVNPALNAVLEVYADATPPPVADDAPFAFVPFLRKDIGAGEAGRLQEMGSRLFAGQVSEKDSFYTRNVRNAGFSVIGRSTTPELAISSATESRMAGITRNPWHLDHMAGGSSGGACSGVAAGMVPVAHASDGGGSIRIPASACGVVGLKPSRGRISAGPDMDDPLFGFGVEFVVARTVRDVAGCLDALCRPMPGDPFTVEAPAAGFAAGHAAPLAPLKIAVSVDPWSPWPVHADAKRAVLRVAKQCEDAGHHVSEDAPEFDFETLMRALTTVFAVFDLPLRDAATAMGRLPLEDYLEPVTLRFVEYAEALGVRDLLGVFDDVNGLRRRVGHFFERYDLLLTPTLSAPPPLHGEYSQSRTDMDALQFSTHLQQTDQFLPLFNACGLPALSLPLAHFESGLPLGVQLVAPFACELRLLQLATMLEQAMPWRDRRPPVHVGAPTA